MPVSSSVRDLASKPDLRPSSLMSARNSRRNSKYKNSRAVSDVRAAFLASIAERASASETRAASNTNSLRNFLILEAKYLAF